MGAGAVESKPDQIRILCVDDHTVVREGVAAILRRHAGIEVVGFAASGPEAIREFRRLLPDVTLMDIRLPGMNGIDAIHEIRRIDPDARVIVLSMYRGDEDVRRALNAGAIAFLLKDTLADHLVDAIKQAASREQVAVDEGQASERPVRRPLLSPREEEVLRLLAKGCRNKEIAADLGISEGTVDVHVKKLYAKLQVHDRAGALMVALERGIIHVD
jgi:DNA-binding NarL/FixJ family response regulator